MAKRTRTQRSKQIQEYWHKYWKNFAYERILQTGEEARNEARQLLSEVMDSRNHPTIEIVLNGDARFLPEDEKSVGIIILDKFGQGRKSTSIKSRR